MKKGIGIYIGLKEVIACAVVLKKGLPQISKYAIEPITSKASRLSSNAAASKSLETVAIQRALQKIGERHGKATIAFSPSQLVTRYFEIPLIPEGEQASAVRYEASRYIPFKMEEVVSAFKAQPKKSSQGTQKFLSVTYTATKKDVLKFYAEHVLMAGGKVEATEPIFSSLSRVLSLTDNKKEEGGYGLFFIDSNGSVNITLTRQGLVFISHDFLMGNDLNANKAKLYQEVKASFEYIYRVSGVIWQGPIYLAGNSDLDFWKNFLNSAFTSEARFESFPFPKQKLIDSKLLNPLLVPVGLALRNFKKKSPLGDFLLLLPETRDKSFESLKPKVFLEAIIFILAFVLIRMFILEPQAIELKKKMIKEKNTLTEAGEQFTGQSTEQLEKIQTDLKKSTKTLTQFSQEKNLLSQKLKVLAQTKPRTVWFESIQYGEEKSSKNKAKLFSVTPSESTQRRFMISGYCYTGNSETEVKTINNWAGILNQTQEFMQEMKKLKVIGMKRSNFLGRETTTFQMTSES